MRTSLPVLLIPCLYAVAGAAPAQTTTAASTWDAVWMGHTIEAARQARRSGDTTTAEQLCHDAFDSVDRSALAAYDAYVDRLRVDHRAEEATVRNQSERLHAVKAEPDRGGTQPTSTYLGFAPAEGLKAYADLLEHSNRLDDAQRMRSLALAYQQVQQAHFQRTQMFRQGQDPRGSC